MLKRQYKKIGFNSIKIETFGFCNRKCDFCFYNEKFAKREQGIMKLQIFEKVIEELSELKYCGRLSLHFYGEPLLDKRLLSLIEYSKRKIPNSYITFSTNGDFLNEEVLKKLIMKGAGYLHITNYDDKEKPELAMLEKKYPLYVSMRNSQSFKKTDRAGEIFKKNLVMNDPCLRPSAQLVINWKGDVLLCAQDFYGKYRMGNINEDSILNIWNNERFTSYRDKLKSGKRSSIKICKHCDFIGGIP
jgi:radical SAM protein with 4Fe4S-binding SPASM domain